MKVKISKGKYLYNFNIDVIPTDDDKKLKIYSPYDVALKDEIKAMKGARWQPENKCWIVDNCERNQYAFRYLQGERLRIDSDINYSGSRNLFSHQRDGLKFFLNRRCVLLAFEMGLGKTLTAIEALEYLMTQKLYNFWLVAPFGAQQEWKHQLKKWNSNITFVVETTYESLYKYMDALDDSFIPHVVVFDESIKIKNHAAKRSQVASELCRLVRARSGYILMLSGAPSPKNPIDWWHQVECLQPGFIRESTAIKFRNRYANIVTVDHGYGEHKEVESWKKDEVKKLGKRLAPLVLVKKKKDCLDLPDKIFETINCQDYLSDSERQELYRLGEFLISTSESGVQSLQKLRELSDGFLYKSRTDNKHTDSTVSDDQTRTGGIISDNGSTTNAYQALQIRPKTKAVESLLDFYHKENGGPGRLVIYAAFHASIAMLRDFCVGKKWYTVTITGKGWSDKDVLDYFNDDTEESNVVIIANPACVHGLTLSSTLALVYYSNSFSVDHRIQSLDRRDRPGMDTAKATRIIDLINLPTDLYIKDRLDKGIELQNITLEEIKKCLYQNNKSMQ